ncbi:methyltransferase domain-containing protein [Streptomyces sp. NPDC057694]|uniref:methyltransferase domain-containing protein n=1 Tax=Streptomyces sp. NPDC057694 TaxID=3346216 RepID=UPI003690203C
MIWPDTETAVDLREKFANTLFDEVASPWHKSFARVPRHVFVPRFYEQQADASWAAVNWGDEGYLERIYSDEALTTQLDAGGVPTSSSSQPSVMAMMLEALDVRTGHRVLEIGTGTGYNLALLCDQLGDKELASVEPDVDIVQAAVRRLEQTGQRPVVFAGDGMQGYPARAPYDRIIATVGLTHIPPALLEQGSQFGTRIVAPLGYGIISLTVKGPELAHGSFLPIPAFFMSVRGPANVPDFASVHEAPSEPSSVAPHEVLDRLKFALSIALPGYTTCSWKDDDGRLEAVGIWTPDGSAAIAQASGQVRQAGPRRVWDAVEEASRVLPEQIEREDFELTITPAGQLVTYGGVDGPSWHLPVPPR